MFVKCENFGLSPYDVKERDAVDVGVWRQMDADAHTAAATGSTTTASAKWWGPATAVAAATASASTDVVSDTLLSNY